ncbi:MAG: hypothetical protein HY425_02635 [Candidatus Levybacteria bacterium]|nr:hypothetical protein [Candidatus Levybacteria bacterium]
MSKENLTPYQTQEKRTKFIEDAVGEGVLDRLDENSVNERDQNIGIISSIGKISDRELGEAFPNPATGKPLSRERIRQIREKFLGIAHPYSSPETQAAHPLGELLARKLPPLKRSSERIKETIGKGDTDFKQLRDLAGSSEKLRGVRVTLRKRGLEIPYSPTYADLMKKAREETGDQKLQEILDSFSAGSLRAYRDNHKKDKVFTSLYAIIREAGFHPHGNYVSPFAEAIKTAGIPMKTVQLDARNKKGEDITKKYYILFAKHQDRIIQAIQNDLSLQRFKRNPVRLVCGIPDGKFPTTTNLLRNREKYGGNLTALAHEAIGFRSDAYNPEKSLAAIMKGCPVPIFKIRRGGYFYPLERVEEIKAFLKSKQPAS